MASKNIAIIIAVLAFVVIAGVFAIGGGEEEPSDPSEVIGEPSDSQIRSFAGGFMEAFITDRYPQYSTYIFAFPGSVTEFETSWDCGAEHWWQVIGKISITKSESHYYHISLGYVGGDWEVAKVSICPSNYYPNFVWNELYRSESQMVKIGWLWPDNSPISEFITVQSLIDKGYTAYVTQAFADENYTIYLGELLYIETPEGKRWSLQYFPEDLTHGVECTLEPWWYEDDAKYHKQGVTVRIIEHGLMMYDRFYLHEQDLRDAGII